MLRWSLPFLLVVLSNPLPAAEPRPATVLLVTSEALANSWAEFAAWKTKLGKATKIVTVEEIAKNYQGKDVQQKIRACVLEHVDKHGTRWVILGGDSLPGGKGHVPDRDTRHALLGYADIPTDIYYISSKDWDANGDGIYGDWGNDGKQIAYTNPKAVIGRIPLRTPADVKAYTDKVIAYESRYPRGNFGKRLVYTCPITMAYPKLKTSQKEVMADWTKGEVLQFFANEKTPWDRTKPGDFELSPANWIGLINGREAGKWHMHGHGLLPVWVLDKNKVIDSRTVKALQNADAYPVITTVSCFTGQFDGKKDPSIVESMLRQPAGGAIAVIAPSREGVPIFANRNDLKKMVTEGKMDGTTTTMTRFWTNGLAKDLTLGEAFAAAKQAMTADARKHPGYHWCQCELNLLGDPTLGIRARPPITPNLKAPGELKTGKQTFELATGVPGATVCLWAQPGVYQVVKADRSGNASVTIAPSTTGKLIVTVSGPSVNAVSAEVPIKK